MSPATFVRSPFTRSADAPSLVSAHMVRKHAVRLVLAFSLERNGHAKTGMDTSFSFGHCGSGGSTPATAGTRSVIHRLPDDRRIAALGCRAPRIVDLDGGLSGIYRLSV